MADEPNQGATGDRPMGESPLAADAAARADGDPFTERPEVFVGAAFAGGFALALLLKKVAR
jgi:hypothetical protein